MESFIERVDWPTIVFGALAAMILFVGLRDILAGFHLQRWSPRETERARRRIYRGVARLLAIPMLAVVHLVDAGNAVAFLTATGFLLVSALFERKGRDEADTEEGLTRLALRPRPWRRAPRRFRI